MKEEFKAKKLSGSIKMVEGKNGRTQMFVDYGVSELREILKSEPVKIEDCDTKKAKGADIEEQICMAYAYLSNQDCKKAKEWSLKAFAIDKWNEGNEPVLDLIGILKSSGECINHDEL
jgi:hypothetical protein